MMINKNNNNISFYWNDEKSKLEKAKEIIKEKFKFGECGIFNTPNWIGDEVSLIYEDEKLEIYLCYKNEYFEVLGLSEGEFEELEKYYESLGGDC